VMTLKSRIASVRKVERGTCVSYGCTATLERDSVLATVMFGYADGFDRGLSNNIKVIINGHRCNVVGRICMDMCMVDITDFPDIKRGDEVEIYGEDGLIIEHCKLVNSIPHELLTRTSNRVAKIYVDD
ncbi:MAG: alanine racemase, partial [Lachnospiraceae bacterium]|nr:alanine racemase [Lachnospiraceae bacterium]